LAIRTGENNDNLSATIFGSPDGTTTPSPGLAVQTTKTPSCTHRAGPKPLLRRVWRWNDSPWTDVPVPTIQPDNATPYYLNLHEREVAHTLILGATGFGKTMKSLEAGHSEVITQYLGTMARFHTYSFGNVEVPRRSSAS